MRETSDFRVRIWFILLCSQVLCSSGSSSFQSRNQRSIEDSRGLSNSTASTKLTVTARIANETGIVGQKVALKCVVSGISSPNVTWFKDGVRVDQGLQKGRITIKRLDKGSRLKIKVVRKSDAGIYKCKVTTSAKTGSVISNRGYLLVKEPEVPTKQNTRGSSTNFMNFTLFKSTGTGVTDEFKYPGPTVPPGYCVPYIGHICSNYINQKKSVFISAVNQQSSIEKKLEIAFTTISKSQKLSPRCKPYVLPLLCHYLFPYCDDAASQPQPRPLCYDECDLLRKDICSEEYIVGKQESLELVLFPDCEHLPKKDSQQGKKCIHLGIRITGNVRPMEKKGDRCFNGSGEHYNGNVSVTEKGFACQRWNSTSPHYHLMSPSIYHELRGGHNFCRNPGGKKKRPWCFTTDPSKRYDYCDITKCEEDAPVIHVISILYTVIPCLVIAIVFASVVIFFCWRCDKQIIYQADESAAPLPLMPVIVKTSSKIKDIKESLRLLKDLGEGEYGKVYYGEISTKAEGRPVGTCVLVVSLRETHEVDVRDELFEKAETWSKLRHPNIISIIGMCNQGTPTCVLYEYLEYGTLHEYLIRNAPIDDPEAEEDETDTLWCDDLLSIAYQVAAGMNYLSSNNVVHGDLATRNCMVGTGRSIKITDIALTRLGYSHDYHRQPNRRPLPVRWMAPEGILSYRFTTETDIWSFGVLLWELFSYGAQPHFGFSNEDVMFQLRDCVQLPCPVDCPSAVYALMKECWDILPPSRPRFSTIYTHLCALRCDVSQPPSVT